MKSVFEVLQERGFIAQISHEEEVQEYLSKPGATFYIGFDPTADSLHVGHFVQLMAMAHMQRAGHRPIALLGGGTGMIGDPSGRTDLRKVMTIETIRHNVERFKKQMEIVIDFSDDKAIMLDNAEWLLPLNYIEFIREIGSQFTVNRMLTAEAYKQRMEHGLTFLEFNYMLLQAYDFLELYRRYECRLQLGGDDQWSNILAGTDLIRRKEKGHAYGMTLTLLTTSTGEKMGKTVGGAVWLDPEKLKPYDFYQYWRNIDDADVINCLKLLTFMSLEEISDYSGLEGQELNLAKQRLAYEVTKIVHGEEIANEVEQAAKEIFSGSGAAANMPEIKFPASEKERPLLDLLTEAKIIPSRSEGRRLIQQKGISLNDKVLEDFDYVLNEGDIIDNAVIIRKGKKRYYRLFFIEG
ncbi:MAG TPA: tyrosine--tRNA ligase [Clostridiaceae bacterium]|nr:tyrosine--tRNA ligase [Clostridiaceae bacterium]